jgi:hypothetical protein
MPKAQMLADVQLAKLIVIYLKARRMMSVGRMYDERWAHARLLTGWPIYQLDRRWKMDDVRSLVI